MEPFRAERLVYNDSDPSDCWKVASIGHSKLRMSNIQYVKVNSMHEYEAGCKLHQKCLGHMMITPNGTVLPIPSLCVHNINVSNVVFKAAEVALREQNEFGAKRCIEIVRESMKKKTGRMRKGILNCHIDGSLRMVVTPQWNFERNVVAIPWYLRNKWAVCRLDTKVNKYVTHFVEDGDRAVVVRPPSLSAQSVQPMVIRYWNHTCMGISPDIISSFHGDYDGDEMHVNPVYSERAVSECTRWCNTPNDSIDKANKLYSTLGLFSSSSHAGSYMLHTTMSFDQILHGFPHLLLAEQSRVKKQHVDSIRFRLQNRAEVHSSFDSESIRGMADINRRYLTQPIIGDMSRIAKIVASCVSQKPDGWIGIYTSTGFKHILKASIDPHLGNSAVRAISTICASAQQVALDSHRVSRDMSSLHDMISDLIVGSKYTLVALCPESGIDNKMLDDRSVKWKYVTNNSCYVLCTPSSRCLNDASSIIACYNPVVLSKIEACKRIDACRRGISLICTYYSIRVSQHELNSLSVLYTYMPQSSNLPITTRDGMNSRNLQWTESTMARHYAGLASSVEKNDIDPCLATTVSSCLLCANFDHVD